MQRKEHIAMLILELEQTNVGISSSLPSLEENVALHQQTYTFFQRQTEEKRATLQQQYEETRAQITALQEEKILELAKIATQKVQAV